MARSRVAAGVLQIVLPGVGRMYAGYWALGVIQLLVALATVWIGSVWSLVDGILILTGQIRNDADGFPLV
ncbi:MAG: TM2 domain-containing protein [Armatimonadetes bacterium]|nr:TM2 domain-containing protein [Armatimonadota bacterium]MCA1997262.1 TM2 domain-containing protein [Armatimonadota bacterium]